MTPFKQINQYSFRLSKCTGISVSELCGNNVLLCAISSNKELFSGFISVIYAYMRNLENVFPMSIQPMVLNSIVTGSKDNQSGNTAGTMHCTWRQGAVIVMRTLCFHQNRAWHHLVTQSILPKILTIESPYTKVMSFWQNFHQLFQVVNFQGSQWWKFRKNNNALL